ncbi:MAG: hydrogenase maturation protease [Anaerolineae bacterium]|jgi:hydrogenase maturation protease
MRTLVLGLGNPILTDDGVGIRVVRAARGCCQPGEVGFAEASVGGLRLLDVLEGYERVIIVDAIRTPGGKPGDIFWLSSSQLYASLHSGSSHDLSLAGALSLGRGLGMTLPDDDHLRILAIEVEDVLTFGEECTAAVAAAIPQAVQAILSELPLDPSILSDHGRER